MINVLSHYSLLHRIDATYPQLPDLKPLIAERLPQRIRRIDRYIELCIAGGLHCVGERRLPTDTGIYVATRCGAVSTSSRSMDSINREGDMPKPLHFVNTLGNSACFYLTRLLGTTGNGAVLSREMIAFEAALMHAWLDMKLGLVNTALVGGIDEVALPLDAHLRRLDTQGASNLLEGSHWLLLEAGVASGQTTLGEPRFPADCQALLAALRQHRETQVHCSFAPDEEEEQILQAAGKTVYAMPPQGAAHGVYSGASLLHMLENTRGSALHLSRGPDNSYCLIPTSIKS